LEQSERAGGELFALTATLQVKEKSSQKNHASALRSPPSALVGLFHGAVEVEAGT
jgi:hypothetical protein